MTAATANASAPLFPNLSDAELAASSTNGPAINATGFTVPYSSSAFNYPSGETYIYIAIRRGPMKVPTDATKVYTGVTRTGTGATANITNVGFPTDLVMSRDRQSADADFFQFFDRLRGPLLNIKSTGTLAETSAAASLTSFASMNGFAVGSDTSQNGINRSTSNYVYECLRRAPSFFDVVCYTGGITSNPSHNLGVTPEMYIVKCRSSGTSDRGWYVYHTGYDTANNYILMNSSAGLASLSGVWSSGPTSTTFGVTNGYAVNDSGQTYVTYLFATCAGVSKVGSYTGNGSSQTINCGFTGGARFVLVKATSTTGNWIVADSARGIVAGNDPALYLNSTAAEVTGLDWIDADNSGFVVNETATIAANTNGVSYIFLAIA
jgi:hypothetical protein